MKAYFAVGDGRTAVRMLKGHRALISYAYVGTSWLTDREIAALSEAATGLMIDSGAFTAWKQGRQIDLGAYAEWLAVSAPAHDHAIVLDVIGDAEKSVSNWVALRERLPSEPWVPVWHEGDPAEHLDAYVAAGGLIALGRIEGRKSEQKTLEFYDTAFNSHPGARYHALGNARPDLLEPYPFESFDATSWQRDAAYSNAARWPYNRCAKETRLRAYIEATETIRYTPPRQTTMRFNYANGGEAAR